MVSYTAGETSIHLSRKGPRTAGVGGQNLNEMELGVMP